MTRRRCNVFGTQVSQGRGRGGGQKQRRQQQQKEKEIQNLRVSINADVKLRPADSFRLVSANKNPLNTSRVRGNNNENNKRIATTHLVVTFVQSALCGRSRAKKIISATNK